MLPRMAWAAAAILAAGIAQAAPPQDAPPEGVDAETFAQLERYVAFAEDACPSDWPTICGGGRARGRAMAMLVAGHFCVRQYADACAAWQDGRFWMDAVQYLIPPGGPDRPARPLMADFPAALAEAEAARY